MGREAQSDIIRGLRPSKHQEEEHRPHPWVPARECLSEGTDTYNPRPASQLTQATHISTIFSAADKDNSGTLTVKEFQDVIKDILVRYPQLELYLKNKHLRSAKDLLKDSQGNDMKEVNIEGFKSALSHVDSQLKGLPATAQVAAQQGTYLARCFNHMEEYKTSPEGPLRFKESGRHRFRPFRYKHFGQFAPLGGEQTAAELPGDWVSTGHSSQWLWYSVYASKQVSWRTRVLVVSDWTRRFIFGRDSSGI
ncbi:hypothetical protein GIB67_025176 [Kingdonia uniflora]|uniref:NADH:ubiquinone reductase (non-electrogenic) n=1 Tax=Kingdonia uniflora TaxID=39325 RepID=A0A7J7N8F0_9MAGN|nr:hypothetical protein GIB67_025176 [Kingdonia uniflora]